MLSAFNARSILELGVKDRFKVESLLAYGDKLLLGLSSGSLRIYRVDSPDSPDVSLSLLRQIDRFSRRSIELLASIKEAGILVSLSDNFVHIHDLNDFTLNETLNKTKGASTLAVTSNIERDDNGIPSIVSRLAVGVKRRLLLYSWHDGGFQEGKEVTLSGNVRTLTWSSGGKAVAGLPSGFVAVDVQSGAVEEISPPDSRNNGVGQEQGWGSYVGMGGWGSKPLSTRLGDELLLVKDSTTLFIDSEGKPMPSRPPIPWSVAPDAVAYSYPYLVSANSTRNQLEVRNPSTQTLLQTISLPNVTYIHVPPPNASLAHAGKLFYVASPMQVWRMAATDYESQIKELVEGEHLDEAISLLGILENVLLKESKEEKLRDVQILKAEKLFQRKKYQESMDIFREAGAAPERVIRLYPKAIAGELSIWQDDENDRDSIAEVNDGDAGAEATALDQATLVEDADVANTKEADEPERPVSPITPKTPPSPKSPIRSRVETPEPQTKYPRPPRSPTKSRVSTPEPQNKPQPPESPEKKYNGYAGETGSIRHLSLRRKHGDAASIFSFGARWTEDAASDTASMIGKHTEKVPETPKPLEGDELRKAAQELARSFLSDWRRRLSKFFQPDGTAMDPVAVSNGSIGTGMKDPLASFFLSTVDGALSPGGDNPAEARIEKLLEMSQLIDTTLFRTYMLAMPSLVGPLVRSQNHCDPEVVSEKLRENGKFEDLVDFLERKELHREALELLRFFGQEDEGRAPSLHGPQRTVTYLERLKSHQIDLILEFAEWPLRADPKLGMEIFVGDTGNSDTLPRPQVLDRLEAMDHKLAVQYLEHIIGELKDATPEFHTRLAGLYLAVLRSDFEHEEERQDWQKRFLDFLVSSDQYRAEKVLGMLPRDEEAFYEARAIVLSKMGRHKAALEIYVFKLNDHVKAEEYCTKVHRDSPPSDDVADATSPNTVYHMLLSLYLRPPSPYVQQLEPALAILSRHGARLEASEALKLIPEDIKIQDLENYFQARIRHANSRVSETRVTAALRKAFLVDVQERLLLGNRNKAVVVTEENVCPVCHKRLGMSVILRLPTGQVVHYGCANRR